MTDLDPRSELLGTKVSCPIVLAPVGMQTAFHPEGELAVARAAKTADALQILSTASAKSLERVVEARAAPVWYMLLTPRLWPLTRWQIRRAERAGCPVAVLTVDYVGFGAQDRLRRFRGPGDPFPSRENSECQGCHGPSSTGRIGRLLTALGRIRSRSPRTL